MNTVRKLRVVHMYLMRNGYSDAANIIWLMYIHANNRNQLIDWLHNGGSIYPPYLHKYLFVLDGAIGTIYINAGFKSLNKLLAVLPKE